MMTRFTLRMMTADNAVVPASLIPLFALGLPGSVSAAILIAALMIHGVTPGPRLFEEHGRLVFGIYGAMLIAALLMALSRELELRRDAVQLGSAYAAAVATCQACAASALKLRSVRRETRWR